METGRACLAESVEVAYFTLIFGGLSYTFH
jgi:hypothetical protein